MSLVVECGSCKRRYSVDEKSAGKKVKCKQCGNVFVATPSEAAVPRAAIRPPKIPVSLVPAEPDDPFADLAALESSSSSPALQAFPGGGHRGGMGGGAMYAGAAMSAVGQPPPSPVGIAYQPAFVGTGPMRRPSAVRRNHTIGLDSATPALLLGYVIGTIALIIISFYRLPEGLPAADLAFRKSVIWTSSISKFILFAAVVSPLVWLGVFITSKIMRFEMPDSAYLRAAGVAALPEVALLAIFLFIPNNLILMGVLIIGIVPLVFYVLMHVFELTWVEALVSYLFCAAFYVGGWVVSAFLLVIITAASVSRPSNQVAENDNAPSQDFKRGSNANTFTGPPEAANVSRPDPREAQVNALKSRLESLATESIEHRSREQMLANLKPLQSQLVSQKSVLSSQPEWVEVERIATELQIKFTRLPSELPDDAIFQPMPAGASWAAPASGAAALGEEISIGKFKFRPPAEAKLDLQSSQSGPKGLVWSLEGRLGVTLSVKTLARQNAKQQRPFLVTQPFQKRPAVDQNLFYIEAKEGAQLTYGTLAQMRFARLEDPQASGFDRALLYATLIENEWLTMEVRGRAEGGASIDIFESSIKTVRALRPGEEKSDPFSLERVAARLSDDPTNAGAILRRQPVLAEPIVVGLLKSSDDRLRRAAADSLPSVASDKSIPQLQLLIVSADDHVAKAVRGVIKKLKPELFDDIAEALINLKAEHGFGRDAAMKVLMAVQNPDPKRRNEVAAVLEDIVLNDRGSSNEAAKALQAWAGDRTAARLAPALNDPKIFPFWKRDHIILALGGTKDKVAVAAVMKWILPAREQVVPSLIKMGPIAEEETLRILNINFANKSSDGPKIRSACIEILREIGTTKSTETLARSSRDTRDAVSQAMAKEALDAVKERAAAAKPTTKPSTKPA